MARGARTSPVAVALPKVSFEKIQDEVSTQPGGVHDLQARSYGYNDFSEFRRPDHYIRHIEPLESELAKQVEYDMDEQDQEWLDAVNADRKKGGDLNKVTYEAFEIIMDRLEKEWFDLTKNIPKQDFAMPSEDSTCAICDDSEGENSNAIVFCDGCNLAVHQDCYGVPYIPEGQWLCRKCTVSPENPVQCILCPNEGGAFKQTVHGEWVHLLCAIWVPETRVANEVFMEPITGIEKVSKQRWKLKCSICDYRGGACIQCAKTSCFTAFHATCARREKFLLPMKTTQGSEPVTLTCYCERHLPKEQQDIREAALANEARSQTTSPNAKLSSKSARAYAKTYKPGPPLVPAITVNRILSYIGKVAIRKKTEFVTLMCRYWSLKREARRGAPLLKRLHLEPWTASAGGKGQSREEKLMKLEQLKRLRSDLVNVRTLAELTRQRENKKLRQTDILHEILSMALFPHEARLRLAFERIMAYDRMDYFKNPVNRNEVPDYFDIVTNPMCWSIIDSKLDRHEYWDVKAFKDDIDLVVDNAILYNKPGTPFYKAANRIRNASKGILEELNSLSVVHPSPQAPAGDPVGGAGPSNDGDTAMDVDIVGDAQGAPDPKTVTFMIPLLGDLEPPLGILDLLDSSAAISSDLNLEIGDNPIISLFNFELAQVKPPPPPSPRPPAKSKKGKRDRKAEGERAKARKEAAAAAGEKAPERPLFTDNTHDFGLPRTRRAAAAAAAFEAEAQVSFSSVDGESSDIESPSAERGERSWSKKRLSITSIPQAASPQVVNDVDNRGSFHMFNAGWILPPDQRRGGRAPVDRQLLPPPKKRQRTDPGTSSRLSMVSTAASENQTLRSPPTTPSPGDESIEVDIKHENQEATVDMEPVVDADKSMEVVEQNLLENLPQAPDQPVEEQLEPIQASSPKPLTTRSAKKAAQALVIEVLDTPATRRQKRRQGKDAAAEALGVNAVAGPSRPTRISTASRKVRESMAQQEENDEVESDLSELSEAGSDGREAERQSLSRGKNKNFGSTSLKSGTTPGRVRADGRPVRSKTTQLETGTLVWAKSQSFPYWPSVVFAEDHQDIPSNILQAFKKDRLKSKSKMYIVQFFDKLNSWACVPRDRILLLKEDNELDEEMLATCGPRQKWKTAALRSQCREAYRRALAEMETDSDRREQDDAGEGSAG